MSLKSLKFDQTYYMETYENCVRSILQIFLWTRCNPLKSCILIFFFLEIEGTRSRISLKSLKCDQTWKWFLFCPFLNQLLILNAFRGLRTLLKLGTDVAGKYRLHNRKIKNILRTRDVWYARLSPSFGSLYWIELI